MNTKGQLFCAWTGYAFFPVYLIGFVLFAHFIPIPSPSWDAARITAMFDQNQTGILIGMTLCVVASALLVPWAVAIFNVMSRVEAKPSVLSYAQLTSGALGVVFFMVPSVIWATMAFRSGHNPDTMLILNDFAWILWVVSWPPFAFQAVCIGLCVLFAKTGQTIIPRWAAYVSLWLGVAMVPAALSVFFKTGPFAWNGLIAVYTPLVMYVIWWHAMMFVLLKAIKGQERQPEASLAIA